MGAQNLSFPEMHAAMGNARFCFVPKGKSAWSLRFYEALFANCVPVVLSDHWELPFGDFLDVASFTIRWPMSRADSKMVEFLMERGRQARCWYVYPPKLHEVPHLDDTTRDELYQVCPKLAQENAFIGIANILERRARSARAGAVGPFFVP